MPEDPESVELQALLAGDTPDEDLAIQLTGLESAHPLLAAITRAVERSPRRRGRLTHDRNVLRTCCVTTSDALIGLATPGRMT